MHLGTTICAPLPSQYAAIEALDNCREIPGVMNETYIERRDYVYQRLTDMELPTLLPSGAFYIFPSIQSTGMSSMEFAEQLLDEEHVAVVPGSAFTEAGEGHIRISYASPMEDLKEGLDRMQRFIRSRQ